MLTADRVDLDDESGLERPLRLGYECGALRRGEARRSKRERGKEGGEKAAHKDTIGLSGRFLEAYFATLGSENPSQPATFAALGVGTVVTAKSAELSAVSWPSGSRIALVPGPAAVGGAAAGLPSPRPFAAVP